VGRLADLTETSSGWSNRCESFNAILECKLLVKHRFKNPREASLAVFDFIEGFYNPRRRHTSIGSISPIEYERRTHAA
jgi:putative transposase